MRILFSVSGIGLGHSTRCHRIISRLDSGNDIYIITSGDGLKYFTRLRYKVYPLPQIQFKWGESGFSLLNTLVSTYINLNWYGSWVKLERRLIKHINPDMLVIDSRIETIFSSINLNLPKLIITNQISVATRYRVIDDALILPFFPKIWLSSNTYKIIIPDFPPPYTLTYMNNIKPIQYYGSDLLDKIVFTGPLIDMPRDMVLPSHESRKWDVVFFISGPELDRKIFSNKMVRVLRSLSKKYRVYMSLGDPSLKSLSIERGYYKIEGWARSQYEALSSGRVCIVRGGHTTIMEAIYTLTPIIVIPAKNQTEQIENGLRVRELGIGEVVYPGWMRNNQDKLMHYIDKILNNLDKYVWRLSKLRRILLRSDPINKVIDLINVLGGSRGG